MDDYNRQQELIHDINVSAEKVTNHVSNANEVYKEMRSHSKDFYNQLALISGGVLSLSVTYLGYLSTKEGMVIHFAEFLFLGWVLQLIALFTALFRNEFYAGMGFWQVAKETNESRIENEKAMLSAVEYDSTMFSNLRTREEVATFIDNKKKVILLLEGSVKKYGKQEKWKIRLWRFCERASQITFVLALLFIIIFASLNLPVTVKFDLVSLIPH